MLVDYNRQYLEQGCIFVPSLISSERAAKLRVISEHVLSQWRVKAAEDGGAHIDTPDAFVMRHLHHPGYFVGRRPWLLEILEIAADPRLLDLLRELFNDEVMFRSTSLFMNPLQSSWDGNWHRDTQFGAGSDEEEKTVIAAEADRIRLERRSAGIQLQIALVPSSDSEFVPGSHLRWDTPAEYEIRRGNGGKQCCSNLMPGAVRTYQQPGDTAAFHAHGLHRGRYHADKARRTLMLTYNAASARHGRDYFSYQPWCAEPGYLDGVTPQTRVFFERFIDNFREYWKGPQPAAW